jgi:cell shape-determining protein MreC
MISPRRRRKGSGLRTALMVTLCVIAVAILAVWRQPLTYVFWLVAEPVLHVGQESAQSEVERLRAEIAALNVQLADRELLYDENLRLKERLGRVPPETKTLLATVLLRPPGTPYDTFILDVGRDMGVAVGDLVFAGGSVVIGKITEVYGSTARTTLFSAPGAKHEALIFSEGGSVPIALEGQGAGSFVGKIPQGTPVEAGQTVVFSNIMPVLAASVSYVEAREGESFQTVYMHMPINPFTLRYVEVRKP